MNAIKSRRIAEPVLWVVDVEQWPRACLRAELIERGYNPYGFIAITDALDWLARGRSPKPKAIVLELRGQNLTAQAIEAIRRLQVPTILLGGSSELNDPIIANSHWDFVQKRPVSLGRIADLVEELVPVHIQRIKPTS
jgi:DNA-binding NtrC family response regulator